MAILTPGIDLPQGERRRIPPIITFTPLRSGWYRCNQTGEKTKRPQRYRAAHSRQTLPVRSKGTGTVPTETLEKAFATRGSVICPHCTGETYYPYETGTLVCQHCGERSKVVVRDVHQMELHRYNDCPHCGRNNLWVSESGIYVTNCEWCKKPVRVMSSS